MKLHGLPPTMREKTRYLLCKTETQYTLQECTTAIQQAILHYIGIKGMASAGVYVVKDYSHIPYIVLRCVSKSLADVRHSLQFSTIPITTITTSGMLKNVRPPTLDTQQARRAQTKNTVKLCKTQTTK